MQDTDTNEVLYRCNYINQNDLSEVVEGIGNLSDLSVFHANVVSLKKNITRVYLKCFFVVCIFAAPLANERVKSPALILDINPLSLQELFPKQPYSSDFFDLKLSQLEHGNKFAPRL